MCGAGLGGEGRSFGRPQENKFGDMGIVYETRMDALKRLCVCSKMFDEEVGDQRYGWTWQSSRRYGTLA